MSFDTSGLIERRNRRGTRYFESEGGEIIAKVCRHCSEVKKLTCFHKDKNALGGVSSRCKKCANHHVKKYYEENRKERMEYAREHYEENRERILKYFKDYRKTHPNKKKEWYKRNRRHALNYAKNYVIENREKVRERRRLYRRENEKRIKEYQKEYTKRNLDKFRVWNQKRRAKLSELPDTLSSEQWIDTLEQFNYRCALSGDHKEIELEHVIPVSICHAGTVRENCIPMRSDLNISKLNNNIFEWFEANRQRFELSEERFDNLISFLAEANGLSVEEYREFVYWCHDNPRTVDEIKADNKRYGYKKPSIEIWREQRSEASA